MWGQTFVSANRRLIYAVDVYDLDQRMDKKLLFFNDFIMLCAFDRPKGFQRWRAEPQLKFNFEAAFLMRNSSAIILAPAGHYIPRFETMCTCS